MKAGASQESGKTTFAAAASPLSPFRHKAFVILWTATVIANIGTWMYNAGSGWLMTSLNADPFIVSLVQVATDLPMFLFALPAGALTDIIDKRRYLLGVEVATTLVAAAIALFVSLALVTPGILLLFTSLLGVGAALAAPAWQSVVPQLVPRQDLSVAVAVNSVGINISRAVGPALAGVLIAAIAMSAPFWLNAIFNLATVCALWWWKPVRPAAGALRSERFASAIRTGFRHARHNPHLRATLIRAAAFFVFASAYWALLPLVARNRIAGGPKPGRFVETFFTESWLEHLRQHERVTNADRTIQSDVDLFQIKGTPKVTHLIASS
ncbi:MFS transporter [Mesorhizobium sp. B2-4-6]|uniref:MFS transporter n=1 Tax=Mesorhizobium sp. B2-4-6 TaxID=2589943 RepID=UPI00112D121F|nr:MFS transporter [Mesorhizobium sp. B2-4-6]TPL36013.1 MFS transporter [Mesorhizobium sp. B2-4-6]